LKEISQKCGFKVISFKIVKIFGKTSAPIIFQQFQRLIVFIGQLNQPSVLYSQMKLILVTLSLLFYFAISGCGYGQYISIVTGKCIKATNWGVLETQSPHPKLNGPKNK
jgi:hypothetical protein